MAADFTTVAAPAALDQPDESGSRSWNDFLAKKFSLNNYFAYYRAGLDRDPREPWATAYASQNPDSILYKDLHNYRRIRDPWENVYNLAGSEIQQREAPIFYTAARAGDERRQVAINQRGAQGVTRAQWFLAQASQTNIRILRVLGAGGFGVALLCQADHFIPGLTERPFVLKADIQGESMRLEKAYTRVSSASIEWNRPPA